MDNQSLSHSCYNCTYHIVFIPKYRRKIMFGDLRKKVGETISKVCKMEGVTISSFFRSFFGRQVILILDSFLYIAL